jgi:hypothetical protein
MGDKIPYPSLYSHLHSRIPLNKESRKQIFARWARQPKIARIVDAFLSRLMNLFRMLHKDRLPSTFHIITRLIRIYFRIVNRLKVFGLPNIPRTGGIFYVNHPGQLDPLILCTALPFQAGMLISWGNGWFMDMLESKFGLISLRGGGVEVKVERMIRQILCKNRFFAIWPEGHPTFKSRIEDGHSSIIRVYSVLNAVQDRIPFIPTLLRGAEIYKVGEKIRTNKIEVHFFPPIFFPRSWLQPVAQGGKSPREMIDFLMNRLGKYNKQRTLDKNQLLEWRRQSHQKAQLSK